jgi:hypothetical protein
VQPYRPPSELSSPRERRLPQQHDGSAKAMREILRGLAAASDLDMDVTPFARELSKRLESLDKDVPSKHGRAAGRGRGALTQAATGMMPTCCFVGAMCP